MTDRCIYLYIFIYIIAITLLILYLYCSDFYFLIIIVNSSCPLLCGTCTTISKRYHFGDAKFCSDRDSKYMYFGYLFLVGYFY